MAEGKKFGEWAFLIGVIIAVAIGLFSTKLSANVSGWLILLLVLAGLVVGLLNISAKESTSFLVASAALLITSTAGDTLIKIPTIGIYMTNIVKQIGVFVTPAAIIVALKSIQSLAKD